MVSDDNQYFEHTHDILDIYDNKTMVFLDIP